MGSVDHGQPRQKERRWGTIVFRVFVALLGTVFIILCEPAAVEGAVWHNRTRSDEGPTMLSPSRTHGLHRMDLVVIAVWLLPWVSRKTQGLRHRARRLGQCQDPAGLS